MVPCIAGAVHNSGTGTLLKHANKSKEKDTSFGLLKRNGTILTELGLKKKEGKILRKRIFFREMSFKDRMLWVRKQNGCAV